MIKKSSLLRNYWWWFISNIYVWVDNCQSDTLLVSSVNSSRFKRCLCAIFHFFTRMRFFPHSAWSSVGPCDAYRVSCMHPRRMSPYTRNSVCVSGIPFIKCDTWATRALIAESRKKSPPLFSQPSSPHSPRPWDEEAGDVCTSCEREWLTPTGSLDMWNRIFPRCVTALIK